MHYQNILENIWIAYLQATIFSKLIDMIHQFYFSLTQNEQSKKTYEKQNK